MTAPAEPNQPNDASANPPVPPVAPPRRKRRWLRTLLALAVLLVVGIALLVVLLPTILSTSPVRSFVVARAQAFVPHGKLEVAAWSLGWFSPLRLTGVKLYDDHGQVVVQANEVKTDLTLLKAARQQFELGETVIDAAGHVVVFPDGSNNLQRIFASPPSPKHQASSQPQATSQPASTSETKLPDVSGNITLKLNGDLRLVDAADVTLATARLLPGSGGTIKIVNVNQPIDADVQFIYDTGTSTRSGSLAIKSTVDAVEANQIDIAGLAASLDLTLKDLDTAAFKPLLAMYKVNDVRIAGIVAGHLAGEMKPGQAGGIQGELHVDDLEVAASQLKDVYRAKLVQVPISVAREIAAGVSRLKLDTELKLPEVSTRVTGDLPEAAVTELSASTRQAVPSGQGAISVAADVDMKKLAAVLPNTMRLMPGVVVDQGRLTSGITATLVDKTIQSHVKADVSLAGRRDGKPIAVEPVTLTADATINRLDEIVPGLTKLATSFSSGFARLHAKGETVATLQGDGQADLQAAQRQIAQFVDLGETKVAGTARFALTSVVDSNDASRVTARLTSDVAGLNVALSGLSPIELAVAKLVASASFQIDPSSFAPKLINSVSADLLAGESDQQPLLTASVAASDIAPSFDRVGTISIKQFNVPSLPKLQHLIDPFVPALRAQKVEIAAGSLTVVGEARAIDRKTNVIELTGLDVSLPDVRIRQNGKDVLNDTFTVGVSANTSTVDNGLNLDVSKLFVRSGLATIEKAGEPLKIDMRRGTPRAAGSVNVKLDAVRANAVARAMSASTSIPEVTSGTFNGKLTLASVQDNNAAASFAGTLGNLTIANTPVANESYDLDLNAIVPPALDRVVAGLRVKGDYLSVVGKDIRVRKPADGVPTQKLIENAEIDVGVRDLAKANTVLTALVPGLNLPVKAAGGLAIQTKVQNGTTAVDLTASKLVLTNPAGRSFAFDATKPVTLKLNATIDGEQAIEGLHVNQLEGEFDVARISLADPIVVRQLTSTPTASGEVTLSGGLDRLLPLLAVVQQAEKPMPYAGRFNFTQTVGPRDGAIALNGTGNVDDFAILDDKGKSTFKEAQVTFANDLSVDLAKQVATITSLTMNMASSNAAKLNVVGAVEAWSDERRLKNVVVNVNAVGERVWPILYSLMPPAQQEQFKDAKLTGPIKVDLTANGSYPAKPTWNESVRSVLAYGAVNVKGVEGLGLTVSDFALPISLVDNGKLVTGDMRKKGAARFAKPFSVNGGEGDFGSIVVDIGNPNLLLSIGRKQKLLQKVQINPVMATQLGSLASIIFKDAEGASGQLDLVAQECQNVPLLELMNKKATASFVYSVHNLNLDGPVPSALSRGLEWGGQGILGDIDDATLALKGGVAYQDMALVLQTQDPSAKTAKAKKKAAAKDDETEAEATGTLHFKGGVDLTANRFKDYKLTIAQSLMRPDWRKTFPNGATIELKGPVNDVNGIVTQALVQLGVEGLQNKAVDKGLEGLKKLLDKKSK